jgi:hypothetical protein
MKVASGFDPGLGMIEQLRELAEADPFKPFEIVTFSGNKFRVGSAKDSAKASRT